MIIKNIKYKICFLSFITTLLLMSLACSRSIPIVEKQVLIYTVDSLYQGKPFTVVCNTKMHPDYFSKDKKYQAFIWFYTKQLEKMYLLELKAAPDNQHLLVANFTVPSNAIYCQINVIEAGQNKWENEAYYPIYNSNGKMCEGTALQMLFNTQDDAEFNKLVRAEVDNYPKNFDYYSIPLLLVKWRGHHDYLASKSKEIFDNYPKEKLSLSKIEKVFYLSTSAFCFFLANDLNATINMLDSVLANTNSNDTSLIKSGVFKNNLLVMISQCYNRNDYKNHNQDSLQNLETNIVSRLIKIATITKNEQLTVEITRNSFRQKQICKAVGFNALLKQMYEHIIDVCAIGNYPLFFYTYSDIFELTPMIFISNKYFHEAEKLYEIAMKFEVQLQNSGKISVDTNHYALVNLDRYNYLNIGLVFYGLGALYRQQSDFIKAKSAYYQLFKNDTLKKIEHPYLGLASIQMVKIYRTEDNIDSAECFLKKAFEYSSPLAKKEFVALNKHKASKGIDTISLAEYYKKNMLQVEQPYYTLTLDKFIDNDGETIDLKNQKDTLVLIFNIKDDCPSCNVGIEDLCNQLSEFNKSTPCKTIVLSNLQSAQLRKIFGKNVHYVKRNTDIIKSFFIKKDDITNCIVLTQNRFRNYTSYPTNLSDLVNLIYGR